MLSQWGSWLKFLVEVFQAFIAWNHDNKVLTWAVHRLMIDVKQNLEKKLCIFNAFLHV